MKQLICFICLLFTLTAHAEFTIVLTDCEFTSNSPEQKALEYVQVRRTYLAEVGTSDPTKQIVYGGYLFHHAGGPEIDDPQLFFETVLRAPQVPAIPGSTVQFQAGGDFNLTIDINSLQGTFAYKNSTTTQSVSCSASGDGKFW